MGVGIKRRRLISLTVTILAVFMALSGCTGGGGGSAPFSTLTSLDGIGSTAQFSAPAGITSDGTSLYVSDSSNHTIRKVVIASGVVTTLAGTSGTSGATDGTGSTATFNYPYGITNDGTNIYVADTGNHTIRKIVIATGEVTTLAGTAGTSGTSDGTGTAALFHYPTGITSDGTNLYVADRYNNTIRQIVISSGVVTTLAGTAGTSGATNGVGTAALFTTPYGITNDGTNLYVADSGNNTIRKIVIATGEVTTLAGTAGTSGATDGTGTSALFNSPYGVTTDGTYLYVADTKNNTIRKVVIDSGEVMTLAGTAGTSGSTDGTGTAALFYYPFGLTGDGTNLYVTDKSNNTIRTIVIGTGQVTTLAGSAS